MKKSLYSLLEDRITGLFYIMRESKDGRCWVPVQDPMPKQDAKKLLAKYRYQESREAR